MNYYNVIYETPSGITGTMVAVPAKSKEEADYDARVRLTAATWHTPEMYISKKVYLTPLNELPKEVAPKSKIGKLLYKIKCKAL